MTVTERSGITVRDLTMEYVSGDYVVRPLDNLSLEAGDGELVVLLGPSGSGKTTLLSVLAGILTPTSGTVGVCGRNPSKLSPDELNDYRRATVGIVFQGFNLIASLSARENAAVPLRLSGMRGAAVRRRADELLAQVNLADRAGHRPGRMSGGQQQRVAIARALALNPPVLLADEPTAHLDHVQVEGVITLLRRLAEPGRTVLVSTHDDRMIPLADRVIELAPRISEDTGPAEELTLAKGDVLFEQGSRGGRVYYVEAGRMEILRVQADGTEEHLIYVEPPAYFGEMGPMLGLPRSATARAVTKSVLTSYSVRDFRHRAGADERARGSGG
ncbi:MAG: putative transport system ATP-binding protein [Frankiales bacterium]|jgi:putative ABC transport system ATP-binding protein|nr:putative transport system ATP-binding protein [Frankiales bacterium]